jgi:DNA adenine methylase
VAHPMLNPPSHKGISPFLKWPGGKRKLLKHILGILPKSFGSYYEPFLGSAALFFALKPEKSFLADNNSELINCYIQVRDNHEKVILLLNELNNTKEYYYKIRDNTSTNKIFRAARLIYLTTLSFNGIYRTNLKGNFNVPYGHKLHLKPCDQSKIIEASDALSLANINCHDFEISLINAKEGDLIYFDPPYTVAQGNNGFVKYNEVIFSWVDQLRLAKVANMLARRGCNVIISNAYHSSICKLYSEFNMLIIDRASVIAASKTFRRQIKEVIFYNKG